ncbi:MAG TPA: redoxin domain-containing protein [Gammaproteobacteria bacterium]|jgi:peroxiredoxin|nr:redoxin domain-containing protein [Gammaproteobacteria bacterium]
MKYLLSLLVLLFINITTASVTTDLSAPSFELLDSYGENVSLSDFKGNTVVLEWTNHDCPFVAKHYKTGNMQSTQQLANEQGVVWLTIISSAPGTQGFVLPAKANQLTSSRSAKPNHVLFDPEGGVGKMYGAKTTPHMYVIDDQGVLRYQGAIDDAGGIGFMNKNLLEANNYVKNALTEIQGGQAVSTRVSKPYGCSVKYKS